MLRGLSGSAFPLAAQRGGIVKIIRVGTGHIVFIWGLVFFLLAAMLYFGYRRNATSLDQVMRSEAQTLMDIITVSSAASIRALDEVEYLNAERLLDNAALIERLLLAGEPSPDLLRGIAESNGLHRITVYDRQGRIRAEVRTGPEASGEYTQDHLRIIESVFRGEREIGILGFMEGSYYQGKQYGVALTRANGGAVVVGADPDRMLDFRRIVGLGTILRDIGLREGIRYVALQDTLGIVAASGGIREMTRITDDPFLREAFRGRSDTRMIETGEERILEVVRPLTVDDTALGLLRIGLSTATVDAIRSRALRQFLILMIAAAFSGAFLVVYVVLRQNYQLLDAEHDRILAEVRLMEEERRRSERLTSMGRLAGGVAHEIRNPLNAVSIIAQRLKAEFTPVENRDEYVSLLTTVRSEIARIGAIVEAFLRYARPPKLQFTRVRLGETAEEAAQIIAEQARLHRVSLHLEIDSKLECRCDPDQFKQALLNIMLNAMEAINADGGITVRARREHRGVVLEVADSGPGIPDEVIPSIFDPYFTTKDSGTGLGLSEVHRIITSHGGSVRAGNIPGEGAVFTIFLPDEVKES